MFILSSFINKMELTIFVDIVIVFNLREKINGYFILNTQTKNLRLTKKIMQDLGSVS